MENLKVMVLNEELVENELVRDIEGYEGLYQVTSYGRVYSVKRQKFLKLASNGCNYLQVVLFKDGKPKHYFVHRLVATTFIENPLNYKEVNHRDENPSNNRVENLEFCDRKYNINYGSRLEKQLANPNCGIKQLKQVLQFTKQGKFVKEYPSVIEASRQTSINQGNISSCCNGKLHSAGKYIWRFKEEVA